MAQHRKNLGQNRQRRPKAKPNAARGTGTPPQPQKGQMPRSQSPRPEGAAHPDPLASVMATGSHRYDPLADLHHKRHAETTGGPGLKPPQPVPPPKSHSWGQTMARSWPFWSLGLLTAVMGVGVLSAISLFRIPNLPNCRAIVWLTASATTRMQCAEAYAEQGTVDGYLEAIALLESLPDDHPLRGEIDQRIEGWSDRILDLAEAAFQDGDLEGAIAMAKRIPSQTTAAQRVGEQVGEWNQIWQEAETIYAAVETDLTNLEFQAAFSKAIQLLGVGNTYWRTVKYDELTAKITAAREDLNQLGQAKQLARRRTLEAMEEAFALAMAIESHSPVYAEAQRVIRELANDLMAMAEAALERQDATAAGQMLAAIPAQVQMGSEIADMRVLIDAHQIAWQGGISGLEGGILRLQSIGRDRPLYQKAQDQLNLWQAEVQGRSQLELARQVAIPGTVADLQAAIAEASQISRSNPAWPDASAQIGRWRTQVETTQDRPILAQAQQQAQVGDLAGAIATARQIASGRALHGEAQEQIGQWRSQIQRAEDQPLLTQAEQLARSGQLSEAIAVASRIGSGRALHSEAQGNIQTWRRQLQGQQRLQQAYTTAQRGTVTALAEAIQVAQQVPDTSDQKAEATQALTRWSWDMLRLAESESQISLNRAIDIAQMVPSQTEAYAQAQLRLREWRSQLEQVRPEGQSL
jgi:hypothetical protein